MKQLILKLAGQLKTFTGERDKKFANYQTTEALTKAKVYFDHAYSPYEHSNNENHNRVLRRFILNAKQTEKLNNDKLVQINWNLNSQPLKCLN